MKIQSLHLQNFRGFADKNIDFHHQFNVIIGENGSGKTAVLDAIAKFMAEAVYHFTVKQDNWLNFSPSDIKEGTDAAIIHWTFDEINGLKSNQCTLVIPKQTDKAYNAQIRSIRESKYFVGGGVFLYFQVDDYFNNKKANDTNVGYVIPVYQNIFIKQLNSIQDFEDWFIEMKSIEDKEIIARKEFEYQLPQLALIRDTINLFLSLLYIDSFGELKVKSIQTTHQEGVFMPKSIESYLLIEQKGAELRLSQLSSGEKKMILMVAHIAQKIALLPKIDREMAEGIVLIDEIDLHLHPLWQQKITDALTITFPNFQFIVTTHSPLIIQEMKKEEIVFLGETSNFEPNLLTPDKILMRIQGLDDIETPERKEKLYELSAIDLEMNALKMAGKQDAAEMQTLWNRFREIATQLDWNF